MIKSVRAPRESEAAEVALRVFGSEQSRLEQLRGRKVRLQTTFDPGPQVLYVVSKGIQTLRNGGGHGG